MKIRSGDRSTAATTARINQGHNRAGEGGLSIAYANYVTVLLAVCTPRFDSIGLEHARGKAGAVGGPMLITGSRSRSGWPIFGPEAIGG